MILAFEIVFAALAAILSVLSLATLSAIRRLGVGKSFWIPMFLSGVLFVVGSTLTMLSEVGISFMAQTLEVVGISRILALCLLVGGVYSYSNKVKGSLHEEFIIPEQLIQERRTVETVDQDIAEAVDEDTVEVVAPIQEEHLHSERIDEDSEREPASVCRYQLGYLRTLPKNAPIPDECLGCSRVIECKHSLVETSENRSRTT